MFAVKHLCKPERSRCCRARSRCEGQVEMADQTAEPLLPDPRAVPATSRRQPTGCRHEPGRRGAIPGSATLDTAAQISVLLSRPAEADREEVGGAFRSRLAWEWMPLACKAISRCLRGNVYDVPLAQGIGSRLSSRLSGHTRWRRAPRT
jgi:hypothetical protein